MYIHMYSETVGNRRKPLETFGNLRKPSETVGNRRKPSETVGNRWKPSEIVGNHGKPSETAGKPQKTLENDTNYTKSPKLGTVPGKKRFQELLRNMGFSGFGLFQRCGTSHPSREGGVEVPTRAPLPTLVDKVLSLVSDPKTNSEPFLIV